MLWSRFDARCSLTEVDDAPPQHRDLELLRLPCEVGCGPVCLDSLQIRPQVYDVIRQSALGNQNQFFIANTPPDPYSAENVCRLRSRGEAPRLKLLRAPYLTSAMVPSILLDCRHIVHRRGSPFCGLPYLRRRSRTTEAQAGVRGYEYVS